MKLLAIYRCLCDETRLRILNLLSIKSLCVCHFQEILGAPQVKISKHLAYLKANGMVECHRYRNWMIYSLPKKKSPELRSNLQCLQDCVGTEQIFKKDLRALGKLKTDCGELIPSPKRRRSSSACDC